MNATLPYEQILVFGNLQSKVFYKTKEWRRVRYAALKTYGNKCQLCGAGPESGPLEVDHIQPRSLFPERCFDPTNLQVLCNTCHIAKGAVQEDDFRKSYEANPRSMKDFLRLERRHLSLAICPPKQKEVLWLSAGVRSTSKKHRARWGLFVKYCCISKSTYQEAVRLTVDDFSKTPWISNHQWAKFASWAGVGLKKPSDPMFDIDGCVFPISISNLLADDQISSSGFRNE